MMLPVIIALCGDLGAANAIAPIVEALQAQNRVTVRSWVFRQSRMVWEKRKLEFGELVDNISPKRLAETLSIPHAALLLTGTTPFGPIGPEKLSIAVARELGLLTLGILDFWANYAARFSDANGRLKYVPDRIAIMDQLAFDAMVAEGLDPARLVITGQPAFDELAVWRSRFTSARRQAIRDVLGVGPDELLVLFASQPLSFLYGTDPENPLFPGYDEQMVLRALVRALDQVAEQRRREIMLLVRPHPRRHVEPFEKVHGHTIRILESTDGEARDLVMAADLVTGMNTILLVEACYLGCLTVSLQPGLRLPDALPTNRSGLSQAVYREEKIKPTLEHMLFDEQTRRFAQMRLSSFQLDAGATQRVIKLIYQMIGLDQG